MAADNLIIVLVGGSSGTTHKQSKDLEMRLKALGIGDSNIQITDASGVLQIAAKLKVTDGTEPDEVTTKGQLDAVISALETDDSALQTLIESVNLRVDDHDDDISTLTTGLADEIADRTAADLALQDAFSGADDELQSSIDSVNTRVDGVDIDISDLQGSLAAILANNPGEETFTAGVGGQSTFTLTQFEIDADNSIYDVEAYIDGRRMLLDPAGALTKGFRKNSTTEIQFSEIVPEGKEVTFWKQGTSSAGSGGGGGSDLSAIVVDPRPAVNGDKSLGTATKAWGSVFIKDKADASVWELEIVNGTMQATLVE